MSESADLARGLGISPLSRMVNGYAAATISLDAVDGVWNWSVLHPWMKRCVIALFFSDPRTVKAGTDAEGLPILVSKMGNGSAGRGTGPAALKNFWSRNSRTELEGRPSRMTPEGRAWLKPGMAPIAYPGNSNHEDDTHEERCLAVDSVGWENGWQQANARRFGLTTFSASSLGSEHWHLHPYGFPPSKSALQSELARRSLPFVVLPAIPLASKPTPPASDPTPEPITEDDDMDPIRPNRTVDTRISKGGTRLLMGEAQRIQVAPPDVHEAFLHLTVVNPVGAGEKRYAYLELAPDGNLEASVVNWDDGDRVAVAGVPVMCPDGHVWVRSSRDCDLLVSVFAQ